MVVEIQKTKARQPWNHAKCKCLIALRFAFEVRQHILLSAKDLAEIGGLNLESLFSSLSKWVGWKLVTVSIDDATKERMYGINATGLAWLQKMQAGRFGINRLGQPTVYKLYVQTLEAEIEPRFVSWLTERRRRRHEALVAECEAAISRLGLNLHLTAKGGVSR